MSSPSSPSSAAPESYFGAPLSEVQLAAARRRSPSASNSSVSTPRSSADTPLPPTDDAAPRCHFRSTTLYEVEGREGGEVWLMSDDDAPKSAVLGHDVR